MGITALLLLTGAGAAPPPPVPPPLLAPAEPDPPVVLNKDFAKELGKGRLIETIEARGKFATISPTDVPFKPFAAASVTAPVAVEMINGVEFVNAPVAQAMCQAIVNRLLDGWKGPRPVITVRITAHKSAHGEGKNGGLMEIGIGTFSTDKTYGVYSTDELALLLGHELAHFLLGHIESRRAIEGVAKLLSVAASSYVTYGQVSKSHVVGKQLQIVADPHAVRQGLIGRLASESLITDLLVPSFGRSKELDADKLGIDLARRAGYSVTPGTAADFFSHQAPDEAGDAARTRALGFVLHALAQQSAARAGQKAGGMWSDVVSKGSAVLADKAIEEAVKWIIKRTKDHPDPEQRRAFAAKYIGDNYRDGSDAAAPVSGQLKKRDTSVTTLADSASMLTLVDHVKKAADARDGIVETSIDNPSEGDANLAKLMKQANLNTPVVRAAAAAPRKPIKGRRPVVAAITAAASPAGFADDNAATTWHVQGMLYYATGDADNARRSWQNGLKSEYSRPVSAFYWVQTLTPEQQAAQLPAVIEHFSKTLGTSDVVLDLSVALALARNDVAGAETTAARCATYDGGRLYPRCILFLGYDPLNKDTPAQTPAGIAAFSGKVFEKSWSWLSAFHDIF